MAAHIEMKDDSITIIIGGKVLNFERFWLRDQCMCGECYNHQTYQRNLHVLNVNDVPFDEVLLEKDCVKIIWRDAHVSVYKLNWLEEYSYDNWVDKKRVNRVLWRKDTIDKLFVHVDRDAFVKTEKGRLQVFESLVKYGVAFVENVEPTLAATEEICELLGGVQHTLFGGMWAFSADGARADTAYCNNELKPHNDNTYFTEAAGLQVFHLLKHFDGSGGETTLVDGFLGAEKLRQEYPEYFDFLSRHKSEASYLEDGYCYKNTDSIIKLNCFSNEIEQIRYNVYDRAPMVFKNLDESRKFYSAYKKLSEYYNDCGILQYKLKPGQVIVIDNFRVLHGRLSFTGKRTMGGAYVSRSAWLSKARVLGLL